MDDADEFPSRPLKILLTSLCLMLVIVLVTLGCTAGGQAPNPQEMERSFEATIGIPVEPKVHLLTEKDRYRRDEYIDIKVNNDTMNVLWFTDQRLGLRAYQYDEQSETWRSVDLGSKLGNPRVISIKPGSSDPFSTSLIPVDRIRASGDLRLVITGVTDQGQLFVAYKDIAIID
jgi:hypothetical protein